MNINHLITRNSSSSIITSQNSHTFSSRRLLNGVVTQPISLSYAPRAGMTFPSKRENKKSFGLAFYPKASPLHPQIWTWALWHTYNPSFVRQFFLWENYTLLKQTSTHNTRIYVHFKKNNHL